MVRIRLKARCVHGHNRPVRDLVFEHPRRWVPRKSLGKLCNVIGNVQHLVRLAVLLNTWSNGYTLIWLNLVLSSQVKNRHSKIESYGMVIPRCLSKWCCCLPKTLQCEQNFGRFSQGKPTSELFEQCSNFLPILKAMANQITAEADRGKKWKWRQHQNIF